MENMARLGSIPQMSLVVSKPVFGFPTRSNINQAVQPHNMARGLKFRIQEVEGLCYQCSENKGAKLICVFVFADTKSRFSHDAAQIMIVRMKLCNFMSKNNYCHQ